MLLFDAEQQPEVTSSIDKQITRFGGSPPNRAKDRPKLATGLNLYLGAFYDLDTERDLTSYQPIPWSSIVSYGEYLELTREDTEELIFFIREMDNAYLSLMVKKSKRGK